MPQAKKPPKIDFVKATHPGRPDRPYFLPKENKALMRTLSKKPLFPRLCERPCTQLMTLFPRRQVEGQTGYGYYMINVDGYRTINAFVIADPVNSSNQRGFSFELSFAPYDFVYGVGVVGETSHFFNFESYFDPGTLSHRLQRCETSDLTAGGGLPWIGGRDLTHILRAPVMGPYVRASVFNEDRTARSVEVVAYLST
ncbi:MAG: hypothetical protein WHT06_04845 [Desulfobacterales bacterium]